MSGMWLSALRTSAMVACLVTELAIHNYRQLSSKTCMIGMIEPRS